MRDVFARYITTATMMKLPKAQRQRASQMAAAENAPLRS
jgi:hypothetical protein